MLPASAFAVLLPQKRLDDLDVELIANSPDEFAARIKIELEGWTKVIRGAKNKPEGAQ